jgi:hypothetical protein
MSVAGYKGEILPPDMLTPEQRSSFAGQFDTILLPVGFELWRFVSQKKDSPFGSFWIDKETMAGIMQALHINQNYTEQVKKDNVRNSLAILNEWSRLSWRVKIKIIKETVAYTGNIATQKLLKETTNDFAFSDAQTIVKVVETRAGPKKQFVVPRLGKPAFSGIHAQAFPPIHI